MLESLESAESRGHAPWLEIGGFGATQSAYRIDRFDLRGDGAAEAIEAALANSGIDAAEIACIVCSASGSRAGDEMELRAIEKVFGRRLSDIPLCAPKAAFGEAMGASGAMCAMTAGLALQEQSLPPTPGYSQTATPIQGEYALVNAFGCDGNNASLVVRLCKN
jgi:3-oxoacyl-(acyl-carrier-protein) synthase